MLDKINCWDAFELVAWVRQARLVLGKALPLVTKFNLGIRALLACFVALFLSTAGVGAETSAFTFQGRLNDNGTPAHGSYDLQLKLFNTATVGSGTQVGPTITRAAVPVTSGVFTVELDFTANAFPGPDRFLEVGVKPAGSSSAYSILSPRQPITPTPYALHSLDATAATTATNATNATNATFATKAAGNFSIAGNGTAGGTLSGSIVNAATEFDIGGSRVLGISGAANTFAGASAGSAITAGDGNSFLGSSAGENNTTGASNSFVGYSAGFENVTGGYNTFVGNESGAHNTTGDNNVFLGEFAGFSNTAGNNDTLIGAVADVGAGKFTNSTAIGYRAQALKAIRSCSGASTESISRPLTPKSASARPCRSRRSTCGATCLSASRLMPVPQG